MDATTSPYSSYPYHFMAGVTGREGVGGQFSQSQCNVYRSAFLRTLAFAVQQWGMPRNFAAIVAARCLPLSKGLHALRPIARPAWLRDVPEKCCKPGAPLEDLSRRMLKVSIGSSGMRPVLDEAFDVSLKYEGKKKAYKWLVRAQVERRGWQSHWDNSGIVQRRLELAAKHYKDKWLDFIRDTSKPARYWEKRRSGFTIGMRWLVIYLLLVKQTTFAIQFAGSMVQLTREEVHDQPIPHVGWLS